MAFADALTRLNTRVLKHLGQSVTLDGATVSAIFYMPGSVSAGGVGMVTTTPSLALATADVPASPEGKMAVIDSITYTVAEHLPDGTGISTLMLERA